MPPRGKRTELTSEQIEEIKEKKAMGVPITRIAREYHVGVTRVHNITSDKSGGSSASINPSAVEADDIVVPVDDPSEVTAPSDANVIIESDHYVSFPPETKYEETDKLEKELGKVRGRPSGKGRGKEVLTSDDEPEEHSSDFEYEEIYSEESDDPTEELLDSLISELEQGLNLRATGVDDPAFIAELSGIIREINSLGGFSSQLEYRKLLRNVSQPIESAEPSRQRRQAPRHAARSGGSGSSGYRQGSDGRRQAVRGMPEMRRDERVRSPDLVPPERRRIADDPALEPRRVRPSGNGQRSDPGPDVSQAEAAQSLADILGF